MISSPMLEKTRRINNVLQKGGGNFTDFESVAAVLTNVLHANTYVLDCKGVLMGHALVDEGKCQSAADHLPADGRFPEEYNEFLLREDRSRVNLQPENDRCFLLPAAGCPFTQKMVTLIPILGGKSRLGTIVVVRFAKPLDAEDLALVEIGATMIGLEMLHARKEKNKEEERHQAVVRQAIDTLSYSEQVAMKHIFEELNGKKGLLVASKVADRLEITRSVIVNALRKLESAGVIESRSLGMKGTFIRTLNPYLQERLARIA